MPSLLAKLMGSQSPDQEVSRAAVLRAFLETEQSARTDPQACAIIRDALDGSDGEIVQHARRLYDYDGEDDRKALLHWNVADDEPKAIDRCVVRTVAIRKLFTLGLDPAMKTDLNTVDGNLYRFAKRGLLSEYSDFNRDSVPPPEYSRLFGVERQRPGGGTVEILDGSHRAFGMINSGMKRVEMYLYIQCLDSPFRTV
jgi:hypothetical protein